MSGLDEVAGTLRFGANRLTRRMRAERPDDALPSAKLAILADLHRLGALTAGELATAQRVQPQSLTRPLAALQKDDLIARVRDPRDGRQARLTITERGLRLLAADMAARDRWLAAALRRCSPAERAVLFAAGELMEQLAEE